MAVTTNDLVLRTLAEKPGSPTEKDLVLRTLAEKESTPTEFVQIIVVS